MMPVMDTESSIDYSYDYVQFLENLKESLMKKLMMSDPKFTSKDVKDVKDLYLGQHEIPKTKEKLRSNVYFFAKCPSFFLHILFIYEFRF